MSKNFETEYKKYSDNTVPDLWSRIEAGVDAYEDSIKNETGSEETKTGKIVNIDDHNRKNEGVTKPENEVRSEAGSSHVSDEKMKKPRNYKPYIGALAAAACMFLVVVVMKNVISSSNSAASAESAAAPAATDSAPAAMEEAAEPVAEAAAEAADTYEEEAEEEYEEAAEYSADATAGSSADDSKSYAAEDADPVYEASEASPAYEEEEAAPMEEAPMAEGAAAYGPDALDAEVNGSNNYAVQSIKEGHNKRKAEEGKRDARADEIKLVCEPEDLTGLNDKGIFTVRITDPLNSGIKKGAEITVNVNDDTYGPLFDTLSDSKSPELTLILVPNDDGTYTLVSAEIKK